MRGSPQSNHSRTSDDEDLDNFCQLEEALQKEETVKSNALQQRNLADDFPDAFIRPDSSTMSQRTVTRNDMSDFHEMYRELQIKLESVRKREQEIIKDEAWIKSEKKELLKMRKQIEADKMIANEKLNAPEILSLREQFAALQEKYETEKEEWENERRKLQDRIEELEAQETKPRRPKVTFIDPYASKPNKEAEKSHIKEPIIINYPTHSAMDENDSLLIEQQNENENHNHDDEPDNLNQDSNIESEKESLSIEIPPVQQLQPQHIEAQSPSSSPPASPNTRKMRRKYRVTAHEPYQMDFDYNPGPVFKEESRADGRRVVRYKDGSQGTIFRNGTRKVKRSQTTYIFYANGDVGIEYPDKAVAYRYKETMAVELSLPDNSRVYLFRNGQRERHYQNGDKDIQYPNGQFKKVLPNGDYDLHYPSGKNEKCRAGKVIVSNDE